MLVTASSVLAGILDGYTSKIHRYVNGVLWVAMAIGFGGFESNIRIDQLHDASTEEISSFILWYTWTFSGNGFVIFFILECLPKQYLIVGDVVICIYLSIALSSLLMFNHWLVKEPMTQNPFKLVYSVVRYAIKHKHPECRSAFTYCEDEPPSRIDFGKSKYGGPFTTEQVEDVKTFLRVIMVIFAGTVTFGIVFACWRLLDRISKLLIEDSNKSEKIYPKCYSKEAFVESFFYGSVIILPLFLYPIFHRCLEMISSHRKFISGVFLLMAEIVALLVIEIVARHNYLAINNYNITIPCIGHGTLSTSLNYRWLAIPLLLFSLSTSAIGIGAIEFFVSQVPYLMRGLIMRIAFCMVTLCGAIVYVGVGISTPFISQLSI